MRFLLHPPKASVRSLGKSKKSISKSLPSAAKSNSSNNSKNDREVYKTYGQQCSPNCGCAIRFEATYDPNGTNNRIISMSYDAKTLVSTVHHSEENNGLRTLVPVYTTSAPSPMDSNASNNESPRGRPILKECKCETVHSLSQRIIESMSNMTLAQAQNQLEFLSARSSPAFRYTVLKKHGLLTTDQGHGTNSIRKTDADSKMMVDARSNRNVEEIILDLREGHCFDLVEEALVACLKGYMPQPRRQNTTNTFSKEDIPIKSPRRFMEEIARHENKKSEDIYGGSQLDPLRFVNAAKRRTAGLFYKSAAASSSMSSSGSSGVTSSGGSLSSSMPPFHLMGNQSNDNASHDTLRELRMEIKSLQDQDKKNEELDNYNVLRANDWLSYVDERNCE